MYRDNVDIWGKTLGVFEEKCSGIDEVRTMTARYGSNFKALEINRVMLKKSQISVASCFVITKCDSHLKGCQRGRTARNRISSKTSCRTVCLQRIDNEQSCVIFQFFYLLRTQCLPCTFCTFISTKHTANIAEL